MLGCQHQWKVEPYARKIGRERVTMYLFTCKKCGEMHVGTRDDPAYEGLAEQQRKLRLWIFLGTAFAGLVAATYLLSTAEPKPSDTSERWGRRQEQRRTENERRRAEQEQRERERAEAERQVRLAAQRVEAERQRLEEEKKRLLAQLEAERVARLQAEQARKVEEEKARQEEERRRALTEIEETRRAKIASQIAPIRKIQLGPGTTPKDFDGELGYDGLEVEIRFLDDAGNQVRPRKGVLTIRVVSRHATSLAIPLPEKAVQGEWKIPLEAGDLAPRPEPPDWQLGPPVYRTQLAWKDWSHGVTITCSFVDPESPRLECQAQF